MHALWKHPFAVLVVAALIGVVPTPPAGAESPQEATVVVDNLRFEPDFVAVARAGTVVFDVQEGGHLIAAPGYFEVRGPDGGTIPAGTIERVPMPDEDVYISYHCTVHSSMSGQIKVGSPPLPPDKVIRVPEDVAGLQDAVNLAEPGFTVDVAPGVYGSLEVPTASELVTIRGRTGDPADVTISGSRSFAFGAVEITGSHISLRDLTVESGRFRGVRTRDANAVELRNVVVTPGFDAPTGVLIERTTGASLTDVTISGHDRGVVVTECNACGFRANRLRSEGNGTGLRVSDAHGALLSQSSFVGGSYGVIVSNAGGVHIEGNTVSDTSDYGIAVGAGPAVEVVVRDNVVDGRIGWDGIGHNTCFAGNTAGRMDPPTLTETASCDAAVPWSVPWPVVSAAVIQEGEL